MSNHIYYRMFGYVFTIVLHLTNIYWMATNLNDFVLKIPNIQIYASLQKRYFTCWTFFIQIVYAVIGLTCDILTLRNADNMDYKLPKRLRGLRDTSFAAVLWPSTWVVCTVFWTLYTIDPELLFPRFTELALTKYSNHVIHTAIVPIVLWEIYFRPRETPKSHSRNLKHLAAHLTLYFFVLLYTYIELGIWIYPIFTILYGTVYFPLLFLGLICLALLYYYMQWPLTRAVWGDTLSKKIR